MKLSTRLARARRQAALWHGNQTYGHRPYTTHLDEVLAVALEFEIEDEDVLVATRFHDAVEDCDGVTVEMIAQTESVRVAMLVWAVTNESGKNRKIKGRRTYPKIAGIEGATLLKLSDRIANARNCLMEAAVMDAGKRNKSKWGMYRTEYPGFRKALRRPEIEGPEFKMWAELDRIFAWEPTVGPETDGTMGMSDFDGQIPPVLETALAF